MFYPVVKMRTMTPTKSQMKKGRSPKKNPRKNPKQDLLMKFKQPAKNARNFDHNSRKNGSKKALS